MKKTLYQITYEKIVNAIETGVLKEGEKMVSVRDYAETNGLSRNTAEQAYAMLIEKGYIYAKERSGYYVADFKSLKNPEQIEAEQKQEKIAEELFGSGKKSDSKKSDSKKEKTSIKNSRSEKMKRTEKKADAKAAKKAVEAEEAQEEIKTNQIKIQNPKGVMVKDFTDPSLIPGILNLTPGNIDGDQFPSQAFRRLYKEVLSSPNTELLQRLGEKAGEKSLREAISSHLYKTRGIRCTADQIVIGDGTDSMLKMLSRLITSYVAKNIFTDDDFQQIFYFENPCNEKIKQAFESAGNATMPIELDNDGVKLISLKLAAKVNKESECVEVLYTTPSHQYPTGITMSGKRRAKLIEWLAEKKSRFLIEDEYDSEFRFGGKIPRPMLDIATEYDAASAENQDKKSDEPQLAAPNDKPQEAIIFAGSFASTISPALKMSYMVLPPELSKFFTREFLYSCPVSRIEQAVVAKFIKEGLYQRHINKVKKFYKQRRDYILDELEEKFPGIKIKGENAGLHFIGQIQIKGLKDFTPLESKIIENARRHNLLITGTGTGWFVFGYANLDEQQIEKAVSALRTSIVELFA